MIKIGILGAGQLARMLAFAARPMGIHTVCYSKEISPTIEQVSEVFSGHLLEFEQQVDVITYETENIPLEFIAPLMQSSKLKPHFEALKLAQDRWLEKKFFQSLQIKTATCLEVKQKEDLSTLGFPAILKTRLYGYDGKGQYFIRDHNDIESAWQLLKNQPLILEQYVQFDRELSIIAVKGLNNDIRFYPLTENVHQQGILRRSISPVIQVDLQSQAEIIAKKVLQHLNYVGVLAIELFQVGNELYVNEMAPRVHNTGHWTIEGSVTSQFANHVRAIAGLPLGSTASKGYSAMFNMIGTLWNRQKILSIPQAYFHDYEKIPRSNRKLGHVTFVCETREALNAIIAGF